LHWADVAADESPGARVARRAQRAERRRGSTAVQRPGSGCRSVRAASCPEVMCNVCTD